MNNNVSLINAQKSFTGLNLTSFTCLYSNYTLNYTLNYILNYTLDYTISSLRYCYTLNCLWASSSTGKIFALGRKNYYSNKKKSYIRKKHSINQQKILTTDKKFSQQAKYFYSIKKIITMKKYSCNEQKFLATSKKFSQKAKLSHGIKSIFATSKASSW